MLPFDPFKFIRSLFRSRDTPLPHEPQPFEGLLELGVPPQIRAELIRNWRRERFGPQLSYKMKIPGVGPDAPFDVWRNMEYIGSDASGVTIGQRQQLRFEATISHPEYGDFEAYGSFKTGEQWSGPRMRDNIFRSAGDELGSIAQPSRILRESVVKVTYYIATYERVPR